MTNAIPEAILGQHTAVLGKTGSGKTSTSKLLIEQVYAAGARVCILDPIKSDWWGLTANAAGDGPGLPFSILGGPHGHVPVHQGAGAAVGELVAAGELPHCIIDMADFGPGGISHFFKDFAPVLMRRMRGVLYLVLEEAHLIAPKERAGVGPETMAIHYAKTLATAGRTKGIRLIVATQRVQSLHNTLLGSCDTMIAHRMTAPADQDPVLKWLKANASKAIHQQVSAELSGLKTGTAWMISGEAQITERFTFPKFQTYDNTATPEDDDHRHDVKTAPVDLGRLQAVLGEAVKVAEENDPTALKAKVKSLQEQLKTAGLAQKSRSDAEVQVSLQSEFARGHSEGFSAGVASGRAKAYYQIVPDLRDVIGRATEICSRLDSEPIAPPPENPGTGSPRHGPGVAARSRPGKPGRDTTARQIDGGGASLDGPKQRILDALAWWESIGVDSPTRVQVAMVAGYKPKGGAFMNPLGALRSSGHVDYPVPGTVKLLALGRSAANELSTPATQSALHGMILGQLDGPQRKIIIPLLKCYPNSMARGDLAAASDYEPKGGAFMNPLGALRTLGLVDYPTPGRVAALPILFPEHA